MRTCALWVGSGECVLEDRDGKYVLGDWLQVFDSDKHLNAYFDSFFKKLFFKEIQVPQPSLLKLIMKTNNTIILTSY